MHFKILILLLAAVAMLVACSTDPSEEDQVFDVATRMATIVAPDISQDDQDYFLGHITDNFNVLWGYPSVEACAADIEGCVGDAPIDPPDKASITIDEKSSPVTAEITMTQTESDPSGETFVLAFVLGLIKVDGVWKFDSITAGDDEIPSGTAVVQVELSEMAFGYDETDPGLLSGKFAFDIDNKGEQVHELVLLKINQDGSIMELMESENEEAFEFLGVKVPILPGRSVKMAVPELTAGRYGLICFLPDQAAPGGEGAPHMAMGMVSEFTVK